ncbi:MAG TPA: hypothetical protein VGP15_06770, partial [Burkholderiales bacterium]|nr:hypothetical protein [Burkholderiales bacterium]
LPASSAAASNIAAPVRKAGGLIRETPSWSSGEPLTPAQLEMLEQGRPVVRAPVQDKASQPALLVRALSSEKQ